MRIFLNTKGTNDNEVPEELVEFLHYIDRLPSDNLPIKSSKIQAIDTYNNCILANSGQSDEAIYQILKSQ